MKIPYFHIDAFSSEPFGGNPAAVCLLDSWTEDGILQKIAAEFNLAETAFLVKEEDSSYRLRWFTPEIEMDLCGHATLASAYALFLLDAELTSVDFETMSGPLSVKKRGELLTMDFPARKPVPVEPPSLLTEALGAVPSEVLLSRDLMAVFDDEEQIGGMKPDFEALKRLEAFGVIVTAPGKEADFVSRYFAPGAGIPEDPVTGSAHCTLVPYWAERLKRQNLHARQLSARGGELVCEELGERVEMSGRAVLFSRGEIYLPT